MELKEIAIIFINAFATVLGYVAVLYSMLFAVSKVRVSFLRLFVVMYVATITISIIAVTYVPVVLFVGSFIYLCLCKTKILHNILACLLAITVFIIVMSINNFILIIIKIPIEKLAELRGTFSYNLCNSSIFIILSLTATVIIDLVSKYVHNISIIQSTDRPYANKKLIAFIVVAIMFFIFVISTIWMWGLLDIQRAVFYTTFTIIISLLLSAFILFAIYTIISMTVQKRKELEIKHDKEITQLYKNEIQNMYENMRDFKHDYMKIYTSMSVLIEQNKIDELKKYFYNEIAPLQKEIIEETNANHMVTLIQDGVIQGTIYNYIIKAKHNGINFTIGVNKEIPKVESLTSIELSRILGIILDNAMEATYNIKNNCNKEVMLSIYVDDSYVVYKVKNTYAVKPDFSKIFVSYYSTKGKGHGRGLMIVKKIIDKHKNAFLQIKLEENLFVVEIKLLQTFGF